MSEALTAPVVSLIIERRDKDIVRILLQRRTKRDPGIADEVFELPQGRVRQGETLLECAHRELGEETGMTGFIPTTTTTTRHVNGATLESGSAFVVSEKGARSYLAICLIGTASGQPRSSEESADPQWYSKEEVATLIAQQRVFPLNVPMLLAYCEMGTARKTRRDNKIVQSKSSSDASWRTAPQRGKRT
jgi:8-oxo-dGTP pyrophosphatase MutT (NUDIX family)